MLQKKKQFLGIVIMLILWMVGCSAPATNNGTNDIDKQEATVSTQKPMAESTHTPMPTVTHTPVPTVANTPIPTPTPTNTPTLIPLEEMDEEQVSSLMYDTEWKVSEMANSGEISGYVMGKSKFLVWKYMSTNITGPKIYKFALVNCFGNYETEFVAFEKEIEKPEYIESIGENIFKLCTRDEFVECYNANTYQYFSYPAQCEVFMHFSDGYALGYLRDTLWWEKEKYSSVTYYYYNVVVLDGYGKMIKTTLNYKVRITSGFGGGGSSKYPKVGRFSEGYFFLEDAFYNLESEKILNLQGIEIENTPYFEDGYCWLEYKDSNALWGAYIDIAGNFLGEPMKLYDLY